MRNCCSVESANCGDASSRARVTSSVSITYHQLRATGSSNSCHLAPRTGSVQVIAVPHGFPTEWPHGPREANGFSEGIFDAETARYARRVNWIAILKPPYARTHACTRARTLIISRCANARPSIRSNVPRRLRSAGNASGPLTFRDIPVTPCLHYALRSFLLPIAER